MQCSQHTCGAQLTERRPCCLEGWGLADRLLNVCLLCLEGKACSITCHDHPVQHMAQPIMQSLLLYCCDACSIIKPTDASCVAGGVLPGSQDGGIACAAVAPGRSDPMHGGHSGRAHKVCFFRALDATFLHSQIRHFSRNRLSMCEVKMLCISISLAQV